MTKRLLAVCLLSALACSSFGKKDEEKERRRPPDLSTPQAEERVGQEEAERVRGSMGMIEDPEIVEWIDAIGRRLSRHAPGYRYDYSFQVADQAAPNAFALPGGAIFITRGTLILANSEAEIANVLGHEVAHVAQRHAAAQMGAGLGGGGFMQALQGPSRAAYSRDLERSADRVGQGLAALAGYDPNGLSRFLRGLDLSQRNQIGYSPGTGFFASHPSSSSRAAETRQRAGQIAWTPSPSIVEGRDAYLQKIEGLVVGDAGSQGVFLGERFVHPDLAFTLRFPDGWDTLNTPAAAGAFSPDRRSQIALEAGGKGRDPVQAADEFIATMQEAGGTLNVHRREDVKLRGRMAHRLTGTASSGGGRVFVVMHFVPHGGAIYRITGVTLSESKQAIFLAVVRSFRPATRELVEQVSETRLRLATARNGESIKALVQRTRSTWGIQETAVVNALQADQRFAGGELVKIAVSQPYRPPGF